MPPRRTVSGNVKRQKNMEQLTKAELTADMLLADVIGAQSATTNPMLEIILRDLIGRVAEIRNRIQEVNNAAETVSL